MEFNKPSPLRLEDNLAENFIIFKEEIEVYFIATKTINESREIQVARLKNLLGTDAVRLYNSLNDTPKEKETVISIFSVLEKHCIPRKNEIMEIYKFFNRKQKPGEPFNQFFADLKHLIKSCNFQSQEEKLLRAQIVLGIESKSVQERILREDVSLDKIVSFCRSVELAESDLKTIAEPKNEVNVQEIKSKDFKRFYKHTTHNSEATHQDFLQKCNRCGRQHSVDMVCPAFGKFCTKCKRPNHFATVCRSKFINDGKRIKCHNLNVDEDIFDQETLSIETLFSVDQLHKKCWYKTLKVDNHELEFKLDSGAEVNVLPLRFLKNNKLHTKIQKTKVVLEAFGGYKIEPVGYFMGTIETQSVIKVVKFVVVNNISTPILGLETCIDLNLIKRVDLLVNENDKDKNKIYEQNKNVFEGLGCFPEKCSIKLSRDAISSIKPANRVPFVLRDKLKTTLQSLQSRAIIEPVNEPLEWVNKIVIVEKPNGSLRVCIDPSDLNKYILRENYTIPTIEELAPTLSNKKFFTILDVKDGFYHMKLDEESSKLCSFNTIFGAYRFLRAPFGLASIPELFQKLMFKYFGDIKGIAIYFDDICIATNTKEENDLIIKQVLDRAKKYNIKFNFEKFQYCKEEVKYLGVIFNNNGMKADPNKVEVICKLENPKSKTELQKFLGMVNYLRGFIPDLAKLISPLRELLKNGVHYQWLESHTKVFNELKKVICSSQVLKPFDPKEPVKIQCDASKDSVGCCLLQNNKPVYFASRSLSPSECNFAQIEKELLAVCFACSKFHNYIYGHHDVTIFTDHMPLLSIINKPMDKIRNNRLRRLKLKLFIYKFELRYLQGKLMYIADYLSRCGVSSDPVSQDFENALKDVIHSIGTQEKTLTFSDEKLETFQNETRNDPVLGKVIGYQAQNWPKSINCGGELNHFFKLRNDIEFDNGLLYYDNRLIVPTKLRSFILKLLHETHLGINKINKTVNSLFYWPGIKSDVRNTVLSCNICQKFQRSKNNDPLKSSVIPDFPFHKIAADIAEFDSALYLIVVDYYSRWIEAIRIGNKNSSTIINKLKEIFARFGIPDTLIADNVPFNSFEMRNFAEKWNFKIKTSSPHYPKGNGLAEKAVGIFKTMLKKSKETGQDIELFLLNYRNTPVSTLNVSPSQLLNSRKMRSKLPEKLSNLKPKLINRNIQYQMAAEQERQGFYYNKHSLKHEVSFEVGEKVLIQNIIKKTWEKAEVIRKLDNRSYLIKLINGRVLRRNSHHIRKLFTKQREPTMFANLSEDNDESDSNFEDNAEDKGPISSSYVSRSGRIIRPPNKLNL